MPYAWIVSKQARELASKKPWQVSRPRRRLVSSQNEFGVCAMRMREGNASLISCSCRVTGVLGLVCSDTVNQTKRNLKYYETIQIYITVWRSARARDVHERPIGTG